MLIHLSDQAMKNAFTAASNEKTTVVEYIQRMLDGVFQNESVFICLSPIPSKDVLNAISQFVDVIQAQEGYYGFRMLTKEEMNAAVVKLRTKMDSEEGHLKQQLQASIDATKKPSNKKVLPWRTDDKQSH